jgi:Family of unknown function (DUF5522)
MDYSSTMMAERSKSPNERAAPNNSAAPTVGISPNLPLQPGDCYREGSYWVFTSQYHLRRGYCCGNGCRHCPYGNAPD